MKLRILPLIIALLIIASALPPASAELVVNKYTNSFALGTPYNEQIKLCACETKVDRVVVENTGNFYADFRVDVRSAHEGVRIPKREFSLAPGAFQEVLIYIEDSCRARAETPYDVIVTNSYGRTQTISRSLRIDACQTASFDVQPRTQTTGLCKPATFLVNVSNVGTFADSYRLDFGPYNSIAKLPNSGVFLQPGESYAQNVSFTFDCKDYGTRTIPFTLSTDKGGPAGTTERTVEITNQYNFELAIPTEANVCAKTSTRVTFTVRNLADAPDVILLQSDSDTLDIPPEVHLGPKEERDITVAFSPQEPGQETVRISAMDLYGGVRKEREIRLGANSCYDVSVEMRTDASTAATEPAKACCGPKTFYVNVRNNGERKLPFQLRVDGPTLFALDETTVTLEPGQNVNVPLRATLPCADDRLQATVYAWPQGQPQSNASARITVDSMTDRMCHQIQIEDDELTVLETAESIPVTVTHTGAEGGVYTITTNSSLFSVQERSVTLRPGEASTIHLVPRSDLTAQEPGRYIVMPTFTHEDTQLEYIEEIGVELTQTGAWSRFMQWLSGLGGLSLCGWAVLLLAILILLTALLLVLIYGGRTMFAEGLLPRTLAMLKLAVLVLIALLLIIMFLLVQPPTEAERYERIASSNGSTVEWYQDTIHTMDLGQYFYDPDLDIINYTVTQPADIAAYIENDTLVLLPDAGFSGENTMRITAMDDRGGNVTSPEFTLRVIGERERSLAQWIDLWCSYITIIELVLLLLLLFLIVLTIPEHRPKPYENNVLVVVDRPPRRPPRPPTAATSVQPRKASERTQSGPRPRSRALAAQPVQALQKPMTVVREYKGSGQTVNIAVAPQQAPAQPIIVPGTKASETVYVSSKEGQTVHSPECIVARRIPRNKRVAYSSKREAVSAGLVPCKVCRPFEGGI